MIRFYYKAIDPSGNVKTGTIKGQNSAAVKRQLQRMRYKPILIKADEADDQATYKEILGNFVYKDANGSIQIALFGSKPTSKQIILFTRQLATMIGSGVALIQALGILADQQESLGLRKAIVKIRRDVENGVKLSSALANHKEIFNTLYVALIKAGEISGHLDVIMNKLVEYIEKTEKIKSQVKSAMAYPTIIITVAVAVVVLLMVYMVPTFTQQFMNAEQELPGLTQAVIGISDFLVAGWHYFLFFVFVVGVIFRISLSTRDGRRQFDRFLLQAPVFGSLIKKVVIGRFCSTLSIMLSSGVNILEALSICAATSGNLIIEEFVHKVRIALERGSKLSVPLQAGGLFPPMVTSMIAVGEQTGALDEMLKKVSHFYEEEVDIAIKTMTSMIEPILIVVIGGIVGVIAIALYLPMFDLANTMGN
jgi:type IV pilus assembly protein PilC